MSKRWKQCKCVCCIKLHYVKSSLDHIRKNYKLKSWRHDFACIIVQPISQHYSIYDDVPYDKEKQQLATIEQLKLGILGIFAGKISCVIDHQNIKFYVHLIISWSEDGFICTCNASHGADIVFTYCKLWADQRGNFEKKKNWCHC